MDFAPESLEAARTWLDDVIRHNRERPREAYNLAVALPDDRVIGWIGFGRSSRYPDDAGEYGVGYMLARAHWRRGHASEALRAAIGFMLGRLGARRVSAWCWADNRASARVMEKAGMRFARRSSRTEPKSGLSMPCLEYAVSAEERASPNAAPVPRPSARG
jgi:ribosomal-protein-alanine N-acetyltransferase